MLYWKGSSNSRLSHFLTGTSVGLRHLKIFIFPIGLIALVAVVMGLSAFSLLTILDSDSTATSQEAETSTTRSVEVPEEFGRIFEVWKLLQEEHLFRDSLDADGLSKAAVEGMLDSLDDPYASFLTASEYAIETEDYHGSFEGIGANVGIRDGDITIIAPLPNSPAEKAGIRAGDVIREVDGEDIEGWSLLEVVSSIRGPKGEPVLLGIERLEGAITLTIVRDQVELRSVELSFLPGDIAHLTISSFSETTSSEVEEALSSLGEARGLIVDVRNNPGGLLQSVVDVLGHFIDGGLILYQVDGEGNHLEWEASAGTSLGATPLVVLINEGSASASEVLAGALRDRQDVPLVGETTFGKGSVNTLRGLNDGTGVYFTIARWHTPGGVLLEGQGIAPDVEVVQDEDFDNDLQIEAAVEVLEELIEAGG